MKQLTCEMCGSTDLVKQDGVFVCQTCGTKYSMEEAKKMMVEGAVEIQGTVEVTGTVQVDTRTELDNLYQIARRARDENNEQNAAKYYDLIKMKDPTSWEASFYQVYFTAMSCTTAQIGASAAAMANCQSSILSLIDTAYAQNLNYKALAIQEVIDRSNHIAIVLQDNSERWLNGLSEESKENYIKENIDNALAACNILYTCGDKIEAIFQTEPTLASKAAIAWAYALKLHLALCQKSFDLYNSELMDKYARKIEQYDAAYAKKFFYERYNVEANQYQLLLKQSDVNDTVIRSAVVFPLIFLFLTFTSISLGWPMLVTLFLGAFLTLFLIDLCQAFKRKKELEEKIDEKIGEIRNKQNAYR